MTKLELCKCWQSKLRLDDWQITFYPEAKSTEFIDPDRHGEVSYNEVIKCATIRIVDENCVNEKDLYKPFNFEKTLIHELLHLKLCLFDNNGNDLQSRYVHQIIEELANAFMEEKGNDRI